MITNMVVSNAENKTPYTVSFTLDQLYINIVNLRYHLEVQL